MKRGLITWDREEIPLSAFESRLDHARKILAERELPALAIYSDVWRSNQARYFSNFMPYWNRALLVAGRDGSLTLLCALSPRVYPWIRSVTVIEDIRPGANLAQQLLGMCRDKGWGKIGVADLALLPWDLYAAIGEGDAGVGDVPWSALHPGPDETELSLYRHAAKMARGIVEGELPGGTGLRDFEFAARMERKLRRAGAEDLVILLSHGKTAPVPAAGATLGREFSVTLAMEYRGHWIKLSRTHAPPDVMASVASRFRAGVPGGAGADPDSRAYMENLSGAYPYEPCSAAELTEGCLFALQAETRTGGRRLFYGDTFLQCRQGAELL